MVMGVCVCVCVRVCVMSYLVDLLLGVCEQRWEVAEGVTVQDHLGLLVRPGHDVPHSSQSGSLGGHTHTTADTQLRENTTHSTRTLSFI